MGAVIVPIAFLVSPSHPVGLELKTLVLSPSGVESSHPSHAVGLEQELNIPKSTVHRWMSPSHTVGSEPSCRREKSPTRPLRSHHPTWWTQNKSSERMRCMPSITSLHPTRWAWNVKFAEPITFNPALPSPSHAVGLELFQNGTLDIKITQSPSHTVGLKHLPKSLKTQALTLSKLKQPTRGHTNPYSVAKLTRVPSGTLKTFFYYKPVFGEDINLLHGW